MARGRRVFNMASPVTAGAFYCIEFAAPRATADQRWVNTGLGNKHRQKATHMLPAPGRKLLILRYQPYRNSTAHKCRRGEGAKLERDANVKPEGPNLRDTQQS